MRSLVLVIAVGCSGGADAPADGGAADAGSSRPAPGWAIGTALNEEVRRIRATDDGGFVLVGAQRGDDPSTADVHVVKLDAAGNTTWERTFGRDHEDRGADILPVAGGYLLVGMSHGDTADEGLVMRIDGDGNFVWLRTFLSGVRCSLEVVVPRQGGGGFVAAGVRYAAAGEATADAWVLQVDDEGLTPESRYFGGDAVFDSILDLVPTSDGGYAATGVSGAGADRSDQVLLARIGADLGLGPLLVFGGSGADAGRSIDQLPDGGFVIGGTGQATVNADRQALLLRTDAAGHSLWSKTFGGDKDEEGWDVAVVPGGYALAGTTRSQGAGGEDVYLVLTDEGGNARREKTYGGAGSDRCSSVVSAGDRLLLAGATTSKGAGGSDDYVVRTDLEGAALDP